jgi:sulfonate dioxygenase
VAWHSDVTYEINPPSTTFLFILDLPETEAGYSGGDTLFISQVEAYKRLSPQFQAFLEGLEAVHSGYEQAADARLAGGHVRREPVANVHPVIRVHPVTGEKALFVNEQFTRYIVGLKKEESDAVLRFLYDFIAKSADIQVRVKWEKGTVVVWDNRITAHSALHDFDPTERRHAVRITPRAEKPQAVKH